MVSVRLILVSALILPVGCGKLLEDTLKLVSPPATCGPLGPVDIQELDTGDYTLTVLRFDGFPLHYALSLYPRRGFLNELGQFVLSGPEAEVKNGRIHPTRIEELVEQARDIAKKIEETMTYPGEIKVTVLREIRAVEYAK